MENQSNLRFTGFYGHADPNLRNSSWDMLRRVGGSVREDWVVGGDFSAILNDAEKEGCRRKARVHMQDFKDILDEMALVKSIENFPYMATSVVRQTKFDHDAILLDMWGHKPKDQLKDPRLCFKYDECWAKDREAKEITNNAWNRSDLYIIGKVERVGNSKCINIHTDNWGLEGLNGDALNSKIMNPKERRLKELWIENSRRWNNEKIAFIRQGFRQECPRCDFEKETLIHALEDYPTNNRNNFIFRGKEEEAFVVWEKARTLNQDFRGGEGLKNEMMSAEWAKIYAFEESINMACALNIKTAMVFEIDNASLINRVKHHSTDVTIIGARVKDSIKALENFKSATLCDPSPFATRTSSTLGPWSCSSLVHHRQRGPSHGAGASGTFNVQRRRLALAPWGLGCVGV
ncbi:hypothetical protein Gotur_008176 [Gossypium turneri]